MTTNTTTTTTSTIARNARHNLGPWRRVGAGRRCGGPQEQLPDPLSVKVCPAMGWNFQV